MASHYTFRAEKTIMTGEEEFISAIEEDGQWSGVREADREWRQGVLGERAMLVCTGGTTNDRLTLLILNGAMEGQ